MAGDGGGALVGPDKSGEDPFGPSKAKTDPVSMARSTWSRTRWSPKDLVIPVAVTVYDIHVPYTPHAVRVKT
jgi:hypothetical protein